MVILARGPRPLSSFSLVLSSACRRSTICPTPILALTGCSRSKALPLSHRRNVDGLRLVELPLHLPDLWLSSVAVLRGPALTVRHALEIAVASDHHLGDLSLPALVERPELGDLPLGAVARGATRAKGRSDEEA